MEPVEDRILMVQDSDCRSGSLMVEVDDYDALDFGEVSATTELHSVNLMGDSPVYFINPLKKLRTLVIIAGSTHTNIDKFLRNFPDGFYYITTVVLVGWTGLVPVMGSRVKELVLVEPATEIPNIVGTYTTIKFSGYNHSVFPRLPGSVRVLMVENFSTPSIDVVNDLDYAYVAGAVHVNFIGSVTELDFSKKVDPLAFYLSRPKDTTKLITKGVVGRLNRRLSGTLKELTILERSVGSNLRCMRVLEKFTTKAGKAAGTLLPTSLKVFNGEAVHVKSFIIRSLDDTIPEVAGIDLSFDTDGAILLTLDLSLSVGYIIGMPPGLECHVKYKQRSHTSEICNFIKIVSGDVFLPKVRRIGIDIIGTVASYEDCL